MSSENPKLKLITGIVKSIPKGKAGFYVVTDVKDVDGSVTFSLEGAWIEQDEPEIGEEVVLDKVRKYRGGWRANHARHLKLTDQSNQCSTQQRSKKHHEKHDKQRKSRRHSGRTAQS